MSAAGVGSCLPFDDFEKPRHKIDSVQTASFEAFDHICMNEYVPIVAAEQLTNGLVIKFKDGRCAFYSASLLYALYAKAEKLDETEIVS